MASGGVCGVITAAQQTNVRISSRVHRRNFAGEQQKEREAFPAPFVYI